MIVGVQDQGMVYTLLLLSIIMIEKQSCLTMLPFLMLHFTCLRPQLLKTGERDAGYLGNVTEEAESGPKMFADSTSD